MAIESPENQELVAFRNKILNILSKMTEMGQFSFSNHFDVSQLGYSDMALYKSFEANPNNIFEDILDRGMAKDLNPSQREFLDLIRFLALEKRKNEF